MEVENVVKKAYGMPAFIGQGIEFKKTRYSFIEP